MLKLMASLTLKPCHSAIIYKINNNNIIMQSSKLCVWYLGLSQLQLLCCVEIEPMNIIFQSAKEFKNHKYDLYSLAIKGYKHYDANA